MGLKKKVLPLSLAKGIAAGKDPLLPSEGMLEIENGVYNRSGAIDKRTGTEDLGDSTYPDDLNMAEFDGSAVLVGENVQGFESTGAGFSDEGDSYLYDVETASLPTDNEDAVCQKMAEYGNIRAYSYVYRVNKVVTSLKIFTQDITTGEVLDRKTIVSTDTAGIPLFNLLTGLYYYYAETSSNWLYKGTIDTSTGAISAASVVNPAIPPDGAASHLCGCIETETLPGAIALAYHTSTNHVAVIEMSAGVTLGSEYDYAFDEIPLDLSSFIPGSTIVLLTTMETAATTILPADIKCTALRMNIASIHGTTATLYTKAVQAHLATWCMGAVGVRKNDSTMVMFFSVDTDTTGFPDRSLWNYTRLHVRTYSVAAGVGSVGTLEAAGWGMIPISKPTEWDETTYVPVAICPRDTVGLSAGIYPADTAYRDMAVYALLKYGAGDSSIPVAKWLQGYAIASAHDSYETPLARSSRPEIWADGSGNWVTVNPRSNYEEFAPQTTYHPCRVEISPQTNVNALSSKSQLLIPSSLSMSFDGNEVVEDGFINYPETTAEIIAGAGSSIANGTYGYKSSYLYKDAKGKLHRSTESRVKQITITGAHQHVQVRVATPALTRRGTVSVDFYRTKADGSIYHWIQRVTAVAGNHLVDFNDTLADTSPSFKGASPIYTTGGVLNNTQVPSHRVACMHHERRFLVPRENEDSEIQYSKQSGIDDPINHSDILSIGVPPDGGRIYALASYSNQLIAFKEDRILVYFFTERDNTGKGANARAPRVILGKGTTNAKSVIETPSGLMFDAGNGIYALSNKGVVSFIGEPVQYWTDTETIVRGMLVPDRDMAVFLTGGNALAYNYRYNLWSTFSGFAAADGVQVGNLMYFITTPGVPWRENRATYADNEQAYNFRVRTPWYSFSGIGGLARLYRALLSMYNVGDHKLKLKTAYDMVPLFVDDQEFDAEAFSGQFAYLEYYGAMGNATLADKAYTIEGDVSQQKVTSVMFEISDEPPDGGNLRNSFSLVSMSLMVGAKRGLFRQGDARRIGD